MNHDGELRAELTRVRGELLAMLAVSQTLRASRDIGMLYRVVVAQFFIMAHTFASLICEIGERRQKNARNPSSRIVY